LVVTERVTLGAEEHNGNDSSFWQAELRRFLPDPDAALQEALGYVCCPICYVLAGVPFEYFRMLPFRWTSEPEVRETVCRAGGFCNRHAWRLSKMQSLMVVATVFADVLEEYPRQRVAGEPCPVCQLGRLMDQILTDTFVRWLDQPQARSEYQHLFGLCNPHYEALMGRELPDATREVLTRTQEARRQNLVRDLRSFLETNDPPAKWNRTDDQKHAPRRSLLKTAGNEGA
jgi:hypothetical protein